MIHTFSALIGAMYHNLDDPAWRFAGVEKQSSRLVLHVYHKKRRRLCCRHCGSHERHPIRSHRDQLALCNRNLYGDHKVYVQVHKPMIRCVQCGKLSVINPAWLAPRQRVTQPLRLEISALCRDMSCTIVGQMYHLSAATVRNIDKAVLSSGIKPPDVERLKHLIIDEKYIGHKGGFVTLVMDGDSRRLLHVARGRSAEALAAFFAGLGPTVCARIETVGLDGAASYRVAVDRWLPNAQVCLDKFHAYQWLTQSLTQARQEVAQSEEGQRHDQLLKNTRWMMVRRKETLDQAARERLAELVKHSSAVAEMLSLERVFRHIYQAQEFMDACARINHFCTLAEQSVLAAMRRLGKQIERRADEIANAIEFGVSSAAIEAFNRKVKELISRGHGYRDAEYLRLKIDQLSLKRYEWLETPV